MSPTRGKKVLLKISAMKLAITLCSDTRAAVMICSPASNIGCDKSQFASRSAVIDMADIPEFIHGIVN
jgi:hypothetical protein